MSLVLIEPKIEKKIFYMTMYCLKEIFGATKEEIHPKKYITGHYQADVSPEIAIFHHILLDLFSQLLFETKNIQKHEFIENYPKNCNGFFPVCGYVL